MTTALEQAFPLAANWLAATVRQKLAECGIFVSSTPNLSAEDFTIQPWAAVAVRGNSGALDLYAYDSADTTTADDGGVSCIVVSGRRYKRRADVIVRDAAISGSVSAQPASPSLGDTYIIPAAPSGTDWASKAKTVATYTARGWIFRQPFVGMLVYAADVDGFYYYSSAGTWSQGLPIGAIADASIVQEKLLDSFYTVRVESVLNAPPGGTPTANTRYQVGTSPTGAFAGQANKIARWSAVGAGSWVFLAPVEGDCIYRKDVALPYTYRSGVWAPMIAASGVQQIKLQETTTINLANVDNTPVHDTGITLTSVATKKLRISVFGLSLAGSNGNSANNYSVGLYIDNSSTPVGSVIATGSTAGAGTLTITQAFIQFYINVPDGASHNYNLGVVRTSGSGTLRSFTGSAKLLIEELVIS